MVACSVLLKSLCRKTVSQNGCVPWVKHGIKQPKLAKWSFVMQGMQLKDLVMKLRRFHCEFQTVEVKAAKGGWIAVSFSSRGTAQQVAALHKCAIA